MNISIKPYVEETEKRILDNIISSLDRKDLEEGKARECARDVLAKIDNIKTYDELVLWLESLTEKYPFVKDIYVLMKNRFYKEKEKDIIDRLRLQIKTN